MLLGWVLWYMSPHIMVKVVSPYFIIKGEMVWFVILRATGQAVNVEQTSANSYDCLSLLPFGRQLSS